jgi:hypothetical protein
MDIAASYEEIVTTYPFLSSFIKFALLATTGEIIAFRIRMKTWPGLDFGVLPKALAWGFLGILILLAFKIFSKGVPQICGSLLPLTGHRPSDMILTAFYISLFMNVIFAPVMMLLHRIVDIKIEAGRGRLLSLASSSPSINDLFNAVSWEKMWGFVYKKTIPFFWIPAHTITFLLPPEWRILFAALLSIALGIILAFADNREVSPAAAPAHATK